MSDRVLSLSSHAIPVSISNFHSPSAARKRVERLASRRIRMRSSFVRAVVLLLCCGGVVAAKAAPFAYVSNEGSSSVSIIDTATDKVVSTMKIGQKPRGIAISPDGKRLYISDQTANALRVIDTDKSAEIAQVT